MSDNNNNDTHVKDNLRHWRELFNTNPKFTKTFKRLGGFAGRATNPTYSYMHLTEHFGPYGVGWGTKEPKFQLIDKDSDVIVFCILECWYIDSATGVEASCFGIGGDLLVKYKSTGEAWNDDDTFKKAFTDAISNAFYRVGTSADIHMGLFDDVKYFAAMMEKFKPQKQITEEGDNDKG